MNCPLHDLPLDQPTYRHKRECRACLDVIQARLTKLLEKIYADARRRS